MAKYNDKSKYSSGMFGDEPDGISASEAIDNASSRDDIALKKMGINVPNENLSLNKSAEQLMAESIAAANKHGKNMGIKDLEEEKKKSKKYAYKPKTPISGKAAPVKATPDYHVEPEMQENPSAKYDEIDQERKDESEKTSFNAINNETRVIDAGNIEISDSYTQSQISAMTDEQIREREDLFSGEQILRLASTEKEIRAIAKDGQRKRWLAIILLCFALFFVVFFIISAIVQTNGNFTISMDPTDKQKGLTLYDNSSLSNGTSKLYTQSIQDCDNTTYGDLIDDIHNIDNIDGSHNTSNYFAYTFYLANNGNGTLDYSFQVNILSAAKGLREAIRIMIISDRTYNGASDNVRVPQVYAMPNADGSMDTLREASGQTLDRQDNPLPFQSESIAYFRRFNNLFSSQSSNPKQSLHKYTMLLYFEGGDKDCNNDLKGGMIKMSIELKVLDYRV